MKPIRYIAPLFAIIVLGSFLQDDKHKRPYDHQRDHFGHIKSVHIVHYHAVRDSSGAIVKGSIISDTDESRIKSNMIRSPSAPPTETWVYDENGNELENDKYHANGQLFRKDVRMYNSSGDVIREVDSLFFPLRVNVDKREYRYVYTKTGKPATKYEFDSYNYRRSPSQKKDLYQYDSMGRKVEEVNFNNDTVYPTRMLLYRYNDKGKLIETDESIEQVRVREDFRDLVPTNKEVMWYDDKGKETDRATYKYKEGLIKDVKTTYKPHGRETDTYYYREPNRVLDRTEVKQVFDSTHTTQVDNYDKDGMLTTYTISHYDDDKNLIDEASFKVNYRLVMGDDRKQHNEPPGDTVMTHQTINNDHFYKIEDDTYSYDGKIMRQTTNQYKYDSTGNWIENIYFENGKPTKIEEREITYFGN